MRNFDKKQILQTKKTCHCPIKSFALGRKLFRLELMNSSPIPWETHALGGNKNRMIKGKRVGRPEKLSLIGSALDKMKTATTIALLGC